MKNPFSAEARARAGLRLQEEYAKHSRGGGNHADNYDDDQPRVPAGQPGGGQWTSGGGSAGRGRWTSGGVSDGSRVDDEGVIKRSPLADLLKGQVSDGEPSERVQLASFAAAPILRAIAPFVRIAPSAQAAVGSALAAYAAHLANPDPNKLPAFLFTAREYSGGPALTIDRAETRLLNRQEAQGLCTQLKTVQGLTDSAVEAASKEPRSWRPADFGTDVHSRVAKTVNGLKDPLFKAEVSALKGLHDMEKGRLYGKLGSIRVDVLELTEDRKIACVYDIKTGKSILTPGRMQEIAANVFKAFGKTEKFVVIEVKPTMQ
jgi:hypothetical protein